MKATQVVFCLVCVSGLLAQHAPDPKQQPAPAHAKGLLWSTPTMGVEGLYSSSYKRFSGYAQFGHVRLTGAMVNSEGAPFGQLTTGWTFAPLKAEHTEFFIEPEVGTAITAEKVRPVLGLRMLYQSRNWFVESWCTHYPGRGSWTNCEPLADAMHHIGKGFYAGWVSSSFLGIPKHESQDSHNETKKASHERVRHYFGGMGGTYRRGPLDVGGSYEWGLNRGAKAFAAIFSSYTF
jgi:hypothetical protein